MTTYQTETHDPMSYREPPRRGEGPASGVEFMPCARRACEGRLDVTHVVAENRSAFAITHGYIEEGGKRFCSKRCAALHRLIGPGDNDGSLHKAARREALRIPTQVTIKPSVDRHDNVVAWLRCDREACPTQVESPSTNMAEAARAAAAHGFVEVSFGTFCSASCVTKARFDIEGGIQKAPRGGDIVPQQPDPKPLPTHDTEGVREIVEPVSSIPDVTYQDRLAASKDAVMDEHGRHEHENRKARRERERLAAALAK